MRPRSDRRLYSFDLRQAKGEEGFGRLFTKAACLGGVPDIGDGLIVVVANERGEVAAELYVRRRIWHEASIHAEYDATLELGFSPP